MLSRRRFALLLTAGLGCAAAAAAAPQAPSSPATALEPAGRLYLVDCLLPGKVRKLGTSLVYASPRKAARKSAVECEILGGEYVAWDRADYATALQVWLPLAERGSAEAQYYVGEIHEKGLGIAPDYAQAAAWYRKAAERGERRAALALGVLHETGRGVARDAAGALEWYRRAHGLQAALPASNAPTARAAADAQAGEAARSLLEIGPGLSARPTIALIEPVVPRSRGDVRVPLAGEIREKQIVGKVRAPRGLKSLRVNEREVMPDRHGLFQAAIPIQATTTEVRVAAADAANETAEVRFRISTDARPAAPRPARATAQRGAQHALVIGNDRYAHWEPLSSARNDARAVAQVLERDYGFRTTLLLDASHDQILNALNLLRSTLAEHDTLVIYYAGHGVFDSANVRAHWVPVDGERERDTRWIPSFRITDHLNGMNARKVLVISDSCYSGALALGALGVVPEGLDREAFERALSEMIEPPRSRTVLTSGSVLPVMDGGGGEHSVFTRALLDVLEQNQEALDGYSLFLAVEAKVSFAAARLRFEQIPQYSALQHAGHEGGDFVLVRRGR